MKNPHDVLRDNKWMLFHSLPSIALGPSKRSGSKIKLRTTVMNQIIVVGSLDTVHFHFTRSLKACQLQNWMSIFIVPVRPLVGFQGPLDFHGHGTLGLCVKATLTLGITQQTMIWLGFILFLIWSAFYGTFEVLVDGSQLKTYNDHWL